MTASTSSRRYSPSLEGARGLAALMILTYHTVIYSGGGGALGGVISRFWLGVPLFFVLSGFLLFRPMAHATLFLAARPSFVRYGQARVLRIVPAYWVALTVYIFRFYSEVDPVAVGALAVLVLAGYLSLRRSLPLLLLGLTLGAIALVELRHASAGWTRIGIHNYFLVFGLQHENGIIGPAWTLCIEAAFYAFLPLLVVSADVWARRGPTLHDRAGRLAVVLVCLLPIGNVYLTFTDYFGAPNWLPGYIDQFAIGMLLAVAVEVWPRVSLRRSRQLLGLAVGLAVVVNVGVFHLGAPSVFGNGSRGLFAPGMDVAFALALASVLMRGERTAVGRILSWRPLVAAGTVSYGIYLWHSFVILSLMHTRAWWSTGTNLLLVLGVTSLVAGVSWIAIERPALRLKGRPLFARRGRSAMPELVAVGEA